MQQGDPIQPGKLIASVDQVSNGHFLFRVGGGFPQAARRTIRYGDLLYMIDPFDYQVAVETARAEVQNRAASLKVKRAQAAPHQPTLGAHSA